MADHDAELMTSAAKGCDDAFRVLFERYYPHAVNIAYRSLGDRDLAEDIAQDAFVRIYQSKDRYESSAKFSTFLYRVVLNLSLNAARKKKKLAEKPLEEFHTLTSVDDPAVKTDRDHLGQAVRRAVLSLPENQRTALILTRYEDMSYQDASEVMQVSVKALESLLHRAKQKLRRSLAVYMED